MPGIYILATQLILTEATLQHTSSVAFLFVLNEPQIQYLTTLSPVDPKKKKLLKHFLGMI